MNGIALYGGSFDPPHLGHEAVVKALEKLDFIKKVIIMPTFLNPFKETFTAPAELRLKWLKCIFADDEKVQISSFEVEKKRKVPAVETVKAMLQKYDPIYFVIGADNLASLHKWYRYDELKELVTFIVASRNDIEIPPNFLKLQIGVDIASSDLRDNIDISKLPKKCAQEIAHYYKEHNAKQN
ncbi:nicotinate (nicotinamide) nucleotide adenylyltransferase [Sulfurimonas paralvinellae]|uniref:Probable nicotinate-nucleotide adenylyltransferase n=1 Tax=Sulfurimonas paralvinellae TaxID=317658 RepID=A0A7M1B5W6_9BACT|nr:nicotinate (nicotinamide) nucleotide adenylyltransferase [Sulfurimonas paralvinellae]QOP45114.1 nicotinate (nicotinamide) nucleotide adenylyltransferase [Sulfurimonas paralvinellae]